MNKQTKEQELLTTEQKPKNKFVGFLKRKDIVISAKQTLRKNKTTD